MEYATLIGAFVGSAAGAYTANRIMPDSDAMLDIMGQAAMQAIREHDEWCLDREYPYRVFERRLHPIGIKRAAYF